MAHEHHHENHEHHHEHHHEHERGHHDHHDHSEMKSKILLIIATVILLIAAVVIEHTASLPTWQLLIIYLVPYLLIGFDTIKEAIEGLTEGDIFNEDFLMTIATVGALAIGFLPNSDTAFTEAVFVMLFFQVGELFESYAEGQSRKSISSLMQIRPDIAFVERNGKVEGVDPNEVKVGETIIVKPGEKIPLDGEITEGTSALNTVALTGESMPRDVKEGDAVISGCINISGLLKICTTKSFGESSVSKIISLVENAGENKSKSEAFITKFAHIYTPIVVFAAIAVALLPPLLSGDFAAAFPTWLYRALMFLIVSCPCALVISVPLTFFGGIGGASRLGILIKGSNYFETLAKVRTIVFDKTGTLTKGQFAVEAVHPDKCDSQQLLHLAAHVEHYSTHPIAAALRNAFPEEATDGCNVTNVEEIAGHGMKAIVEGHIVYVGNTRLMDKIHVKWHGCHHIGTIVHVAIDGEYAGHIVISDQIKSNSSFVLSLLKSQGVTKTVMLTGDREEVARHVAEEIWIDEYHAELLPTDKVRYVEQYLKEKPAGTTLAFVGDGINDAPALALADLGIAMGGLGSDAAIEAADVVLMNDNTANISYAISFAHRTIRIARQNIWFAISVKLLVLILATFGLCDMWLAVFADVGVTVLAVLNAMRALKKPTGC